MSDLIRVENLSKSFTFRRGLAGGLISLDALKDINLSVRPGETLAIVGESGCGKTTLGRCIVKAMAPTSGKVLYTPENGETIDLVGLKKRQMKPWRRDIRMIFQDPMSSLNPYMRVFDIVAEPLRIHKIAKGRELEDRVAAALQKVGIDPAAGQRFPHAFSGGQRQRIGIARALVLDPRLVIADEAVSALDVSIQAQILNLLEDLKDDFGLTYIFISHDLGVVNYISDRVAVMYLGNIVELADTETLFERPRHPYTEVLLEALPIADPNRRLGKRTEARGEIPYIGNRPKGCPFHTRCRFTQDRCRSERPELRKIDATEVACHFAETIDLRGAYDSAPRPHVSQKVSP